MSVLFTISHKVNLCLHVFLFSMLQLKKLLTMFTALCTRKRRFQIIPVKKWCYRRADCRLLCSCYKVKEDIGISPSKKSYYSSKEHRIVQLQDINLKYYRCAYIDMNRSELKHVCSAYHAYRCTCQAEHYKLFLDTGRCMDICTCT